MDREHKPIKIFLIRVKERLSNIDSWSSEIEKKITVVNGVFFGKRQFLVNKSFNMNDREQLVKTNGFFGVRK